MNIEIDRPALLASEEGVEKAVVARRPAPTVARRRAVAAAGLGQGGHRLARALTFVLMLAGLLAPSIRGDARAQTPVGAPDRLPVVATFSILGDLVRQVGGERVALTVLVGPGGDAHVYSPQPGDARALKAARVVVANGLGYEGWFIRLLKTADTPARTLFVASDIKPLRGEARGHAGDRHDHASTFDPHAWQSVGNAKVFVARIRDALSDADPAGKEVYVRNAEAYLAVLAALDTDIRTALDAIPRERRIVVTSHDSLGYFGRDYGVTFLAPRGISTDAEPSAKQVGELIRQIRREKVRAVFVESITDRRLIERIAAETGAVVGGTLHADTLSPSDGPAPTYEAMMRHNVETLAKALAAGS